MRRLVAIETTPGVFPGLQNDSIYNYGYDAKSRLTKVDQVDNLTCVTRDYTFDGSGNRLSKTTKLQASTGSVCDVSSALEFSDVQNLTYNNYSQLTNTGYVYDVFGRATTVPSIHTANQAGNVTFAYSPEDRILSQTQGSTKTDYNYDALGRRYQDKVGSIVKTVRHYTDETDNPSWVTGTGTAAAQTDIFTTALASNLNATSKVNGTTTTTYLNIGNLHGDTITSLQLPTTGYVSGPNELNVFDEYGVQQAPELDNRPVGAPTPTDTTQLFVLNYGSLGQPQREITDTGIQFMGARGYNPITGQFLSPDPVQGGNETPYNYPNDPINMSDISGSLGMLTSMLINFGAVALATAFFAGSCVITAGLCLVVASVAGALIGGALAAKVENTLGYYTYGITPGEDLVKTSKDAAIGSTYDFFGSELAKQSKSYKKSRSPSKRQRISKIGGGALSTIVDLTIRGSYVYDDYKRQGKSWDWFRSLIY